MKKTIFMSIVIGLIFLFAKSVSAGSVPEDFLLEDYSLLFFGEIVSYDKKSNDIIILPTQKIKGDVNVGVEQRYSRISHSRANPVRGKTYLMGYYDQNNPLYILKISGTDTKNLKIAGSAEDKMWGRLEQYLNELEFERAEAERLAKIDGSSVPFEFVPTPIPKPINNFLTHSQCLLLGAVIVAISFCVIVFLRKRRNSLRNNNT